MITRCLWILLTVSPAFAYAQEWWFWPEYTLEQKARNFPGNRLNEPVPPLLPVRQETVPLIFYGEEPTERKENFVPAGQVPRENFSVELWLVNHVNQLVGALVTLKSKYTAEEPNWLVGMHGKEILFSLHTQDSPFASLIRHELKNRGWKSYWFHVVAVYDGAGMHLYVNGEPVATVPVGKRTHFDVGSAQLEAAAYMVREPYMDFGNMVKMIHLHDGALNRKEVQGRFAKLQKMASVGKLFPDLFHFNAGP